MWFWVIGRAGEPTDEELMARYQAGDAQALGVLYDRYANRLKAFAWQQGARRPEDVVQDAFMRVVRNGGSFKGNAKFKTWLFSIARNLCIDASRRDRFRVMPSLDQPMRDDRTQTLGDRVADTSPQGDGLRALADRQFLGDFEEALASLPDEQREVFVMRQTSGMAFADIAQVVGCGENTVKSRMRYALTALRKALEHHL